MLHWSVEKEFWQLGSIVAGVVGCVVVAGVVGCVVVAIGVAVGDTAAVMAGAILVIIAGLNVVVLKLSSR